MRSKDMKMRKIQIKHFRSLEDVTIHPQDILVLVGRNGSGKSNVLKALQLFFERSTRIVNEECFFRRETAEPIEIIVAFEQLSEWEEEQFRPWMAEDRLTVGTTITCSEDGSFDIDTFAITRVPEPEWLREGSISGAKIDDWWASRNELRVQGLNFASALGSKKPTVTAWKEAARDFVSKHRAEIPFVEMRLNNPKGYAGVLKGALPEFIYVPAVRDISEEAKVAKTNPFGQLIHSVLAGVADEQRLVISEQIKRIENCLNRCGGEERLSEIKTIEKRLNELVQEIMDCDIEIEMLMPQLEDIFVGARIFADDGMRTSIEMKGHGLQRAMIFTILRAYAELAHARKAGEKARERTTVFAIEEPEIYMHPQSQRTLMAVFRHIADVGDQVAYSTHSSLFVDIGYFDELCIMHRDEREVRDRSHCTQLSVTALLADLKACKNVDGTELGIREQYAHVFDPVVNEGFFADKVVIVEGPSEQYSLPIYADALEFNFDRHNVSVVHTNGKGSMDRLLRIFNGFRLPAFLWFDADKGNTDVNTCKKTLELLELLGNPTDKIENVTTMVRDDFAVLEHTFERLLEEELDDYRTLVEQAAHAIGPCGKPLKHRFIANALRQRVRDGAPAEEVLPRTIIEIVNRIRNLSYQASILRQP
jgi:predicted ATP-dependent endonuclease of OLD family